MEVKKSWTMLRQIAVQILCSHAPASSHAYVFNEAEVQDMKIIVHL